MRGKSSKIELGYYSARPNNIVKLKLDLHPIFSDTRQIEMSLQSIIDEACDKRAAEVEIIPGKGSGALKKTVIRFLERPEVKSKYHRIEKDSDNWGRLFVHFRWDRTQDSKPASKPAAKTVEARCFCCESTISVPYDEEKLTIERVDVVTLECASCGSPNRVTLSQTRGGKINSAAQSGYEVS